MTQNHTVNQVNVSFFLNFINSLLMLLFVNYLFENSFVNSIALYSFNWYKFLIKILFKLLNTMFTNIPIGGICNDVILMS